MLSSAYQQQGHHEPASSPSSHAITISDIFIVIVKMHAVTYAQHPAGGKEEQERVIIQHRRITIT